MKRRILIIDDEEYMRKLIKRSLINQNYHIDEACSAEVALLTLNEHTYDLIILDLTLGDMDGFDFIQEIKALKIKTPIMIVSGRTEDYDQILGLGLGAVNYITKPFSPAVLSAHVKAQINTYLKYKEKGQDSSSNLVKGPFKFDYYSYKLYKNNEFIDLSSKEILLMKFLMENPGQVFTKDQLYEKVWENYIADDNIVMVYIHQLRKKVESNPKEPKHILTVWGIGYKFIP